MSRARDTSSTVLPIFISVMAIVALLLAVIGVPLALVYFVGWPVPTPLPTGAELGDIFAGRSPIPGDYLASVLAIVMWVLWTQFAWATVVEVAAAIRGRLAARARVMPGVQHTVGKLVAAATLLATSMTSKPVAAGPLVPVVATQSVDPASTSPEESTDKSSIGDPKPYITKQGDTWWGIAEDTLGAGTRWKEVRGLNLGRTMSDGSTISAATDLLKPEWRLLLPSSATVTEIGTSQAREVTVERGDTIWAIAKEDLGGEAKAGELDIAEHAEQIAEINTDQLKGNPDMIYPGQTLGLPGAGTSTSTSRTPAAETPSAELRTGDGQSEPAAGVEPAAPVARPSMPTINASPPAVGTGDVAQRSTQGPTPQPTGDEPESKIEADRSTGPAAETPEPTAKTPDEAAGTVETQVPVAETPDEAEDTVATSEQAVDSPEVEPDDSAMQVPRREPVGPEIAPDERTGIGTVSLAGATAETPGQPTPTSPPSSSTVVQPSVVAEEQSAPRPSGDFRRGPALESELQAIDFASGDVVDTPVTADLATNSELSETEITIGRAAGEASPALGTDDSRAPVYMGLAALTLIGGYLYKAKGRRRETELRHRHPGKRPAQPKRRTKSVARRLAAASGPEHPEFVNVGLRALSRQLRKVPARRLPEVAGVWVADDRLVVTFTEDSPTLNPPEPFTEFLDGSGWSLARSDFAKAREIAEGANGPLPLLTTLGTTTALDLALTTSSRAPADAYGLSTSLLFAVDLEPGRVISVDANDEATTIEVLTTMALELATSETADQAEIVCVGFGHRLAAMERVIVVDEISEILPDLESITSRAIYAAADATPFATRVGNGAVDTWNPVVVLHADPNDSLVETLIDLASRTVGGVTAICGYPTGSGWSIHVDGSDIRCPNLPGQLSQHEFKRPQLDGTDEVLEIFEEPSTEVDLDDEFWEPMEPINVDDFNWGGPADDPVARDTTDAVSLAADTDPDALWDSLSHVDADSWPDTELPALKRLRHSIEQMSEDDLPSEEADEELVDENYQLRREPGTDDDPDTTEQRRLSAAEVQSIRAIRPRDRDHRPRLVEPTDSGAGSDRDHAAQDQRDRGHTDRDQTAQDQTDRDHAGSVRDSYSDPLDDDAAATEVRVSVLGPLTVEGHHVGDTSKPWKYTKTPELILYLLMYPDGANQDLLMERLFPEQPPNRPRLNQLVSDARTKALGKNGDGEYHLPHASPTEPFYRLLPSVGFDLRDFAQHCANARKAESMQVQQREWTAALELVRGRPFTVPNDGYEWAMPEVEATIVKVEEAASELTDIAFELGDYELAVWATKRGLLTGTGYYELLVKRGKAAMLLQDPEEIVRAFADLQASLEYRGVPEEGMPDLSAHPELQSVYDQLSNGGRAKERSGRS